MTSKHILKQFQKRAKKLDALRNDKRYTEVIAFLSAKGLLESNKIKAHYKRGQKIPLTHFLWAAKNLEPRIYEVLPAAILHFPTSIESPDNDLPEDLAAILKHLKTGKNEGPTYKHADYSLIKKWANTTLTDKRAKPLSEKKIARTFRLKPDTIAQIRAGAQMLGISDAEFLEQLIHREILITLPTATEGN